jgi:hypothetical protein
VLEWPCVLQLFCLLDAPSLLVLAGRTWSAAVPVGHRLNAGLSIDLDLKLNMPIALILDVLRASVLDGVSALDSPRDLQVWVGASPSVRSASIFISTPISTSNSRFSLDWLGFVELLTCGPYATMVFMPRHLLDAVLPAMGKEAAHLCCLVYLAL